MAEKGEGVPSVEEQVMEEENAVLQEESEISEGEKEEEELFEVECLLGKKVRSVSKQSSTYSLCIVQACAEC